MNHEHPPAEPSPPVAVCTDCGVEVTEEQLATGMCPHCGHPLLEDVGPPSGDEE
jgi:Zn finger protein HypA/HybF involved in hydrogenase expression